MSALTAENIAAHRAFIVTLAAARNKLRPIWFDCLDREEERAAA